MKIKLAVISILILFSRPIYALALSEKDSVNLELTILPNVVSYFEKGKISAKTNTSHSIIMTKKFSDFELEYTIFIEP